MRVTIYDTTERSAPWLSTFWALGSSLSRADVVLPVASWEEAYAGLDKLNKPVTLLQVWGHGSEGRPLVDGRVVNLVALSASVDLRQSSEVWFRACDVASGSPGRAFVQRAVDVLGCRVVAHCAVISWPNPLWQRQIVGLRVGETPWWSLSGDERPGCSTLRMTPPAKAYKD